MKSAVIFYHKNIENIYKREWIDECVQSIKGQTYQDFDVFELNYGDGNNKYCDKIKDEDGYYFYGLPFDNHIHAMNFLISEVFFQGYDVVFNTNMDDQYSQYRFAKQLGKIGEGYQLVSSNFYYVSEKRNIINTLCMTGHGDIGTNLAINHNVIAHPVVCLHKSFWDDDLHYNDLLGYEDLDLWQRAYNKGKRFCILEDYLLYYRIHTNQVTKTYSGK